MFRFQNRRHLFRSQFFRSLHMTSPFVIVKVRLSHVSLSNFFHFRLDMELDDLPKKRLKELIFEETGSFTPRPQPPPEQGQQQPHQVWPLTHFHSVSFCKKSPGGQMYPTCVYYRWVIGRVRVVSWEGQSSVEILKPILECTQNL